MEVINLCLVATIMHFYINDRIDNIKEQRATLNKGQN